MATNPYMEDRCSAGTLMYSMTKVERGVVEKQQREESAPPNIPDCLDKMLAKIFMTTAVCEY